MSEIKQGALVKAWDDDASDYVIARYDDQGISVGHYVNTHGVGFRVINAIEIPPELAAQLEALGVE